MKFFVPAAEDAAQAEAVYQSIRRFLAEQVGRLTSKRIYRIQFSHNDKQYNLVPEREIRCKSLACAAYLDCRLRTKGNGPQFIAVLSGDYKGLFRATSAQCGSCSFAGKA
jgi:hypothetical protein